MDFAFVINNQYVNMMLVTVQSIIDNDGHNHTFYIFTSGLNDCSVEKISSAMCYWHSKYVIINVDDSCLCNAPILRNDFNRTPYYKLLIPIYIPKSVHKLLYMDVDMVVNRSLHELYNMEFDECFAAVPDIQRNRIDDNYLNRLGINKTKGERYFNSGLILFNMDAFRRVYKLSDALEYIDKYGHQFKYHDQEVLNGLYFKHYRQLPYEYNTFASFLGIVDFLKYILFNNQRKANNIYIIHYANASLKPWKNDFFGKYEGIFWQYAARSPVYGEIKGGQKNKLSAQISTTFKRIKKRIKR